MSEYQVIARKYRPKTFDEIIGQEAVVTTLKNAIIHNRLAHAYLFCGPRGTGKTTLARVFAKALNCPNLDKDCKPCNTCSICRDISNGNSLDILEIDGASHRGIDDIRQINETVGYSTPSGGYKIYIIDEVHMLTKEAFNALLKTLEEPPEKVKFFFATTEPHKMLPTILSRCQRFNLNRIPLEKIIEKLKLIATDQHVSCDEEALQMIASSADGGLRDAESLFDQILAFHEGDITKEAVSSVLGIMSKDRLFELDVAGNTGNCSLAFEISEEVFSSGKDFLHFVDMLTQHIRNILQVKIAGVDAPWLSLSDSERLKYEKSAHMYTQEQCMNLLDYLVKVQETIRFMPSGRVALETILLHIIRSHRSIPIELLVKRLAEMEIALQSKLSDHHSNTQNSKNQPSPPPQTTHINDQAEGNLKNSLQHDVTPKICKSPQISTPATEKPININKPSNLVSKEQKPVTSNNNFTASEINFIDQTSKTDFSSQPKKDEAIKENFEKKPLVQNQSNHQAIPQSIEIENGKLKEAHTYDTLLQFAAVELEGKVTKKNIKYN